MASACSSTRAEGQGERIDPINHLREMGGKDRYVSPYQGREYPAGALEVITMAFHYVYQVNLYVGSRSYHSDLLNKDPEMLDLVIGVLLRLKCLWRRDTGKKPCIGQGR